MRKILIGAGVIALVAGMALAETDYQAKRELNSIRRGLDNGDQIQTLRVKNSGTVGGDLAVTGDVTVNDVTASGALGVTGTATVDDLAATGAVTIAETLDVVGRINCDDVTVTGLVTIVETADVTGGVTTHNGLTFIDETGTYTGVLNIVGTTFTLVVNGTVTNTLDADVTSE